MEMGSAIYARPTLREPDEVELISNGLDTCAGQGRNDKSSNILESRTSHALCFLRELVQSSYYWLCWKAQIGALTPGVKWYPLGRRICTCKTPKLISVASLTVIIIGFPAPLVSVRAPR